MKTKRKYADVTFEEMFWYVNDEPDETMIYKEEGALALYQALLDNYHLDSFPAGASLTMEARVTTPGWGGNAKYCDSPQLILTPCGEEVLDGVSMGCQYSIWDVNGDKNLGVITLCWEGLIRGFECVEPGELHVHLAKDARVALWEPLPEVER